MDLDYIAEKILKANAGEIDPVMRSLGTDINAAQKEFGLDDDQLGKLTACVWNQLQEYFVAY